MTKKKVMMMNFTQWGEELNNKIIKFSNSNFIKIIGNIFEHSEQQHEPDVLKWSNQRGV